jgi:hypothetical protein
LAEPDTVVIAAGTRRLIGDLFECRDLGAIEVKGIAAPVRAWQVLRASGVASRFEALRGSVLTPLIGRNVWPGVWRSALCCFALQIVERTEERWMAAELNRHKGRLLLQQGHAEAGENFYRKALSIAEEQEAKIWELRAAVSLARLRRDQGRSAEARNLLAPVYGWFTEGFDTADLKEAKGLLDGLR